MTESCSDFCLIKGWLFYRRTLPIHSRDLQSRQIRKIGWLWGKSSCFIKNSKKQQLPFTEQETHAWLQLPWLVSCGKLPMKPLTLNNDVAHSRSLLLNLSGVPQSPRALRSGMTNMLLLRGVMLRPRITRKLCDLSCWPISSQRLHSIVFLTGFWMALSISSGTMTLII